MQIIGDHIKKSGPAEKYDYCKHERLTVYPEVVGAPHGENDASQTAERPSVLIQVYCPDCKKVSLFLAEGSIF